MTFGVFPECYDKLCIWGVSSYKKIQKSVEVGSGFWSINKLIFFDFQIYACLILTGVINPLIDTKTSEHDFMKTQIS